MNHDRLTAILKQVSDGQLTIGDAQTLLSKLAFEDIDFAHVDHHRSLRKGFPEVIFGQGKTSSQIAGILASMADHEDVIMVTRIDPDKALSVQAQFPGTEYHEDARILLFKNREPEIRASGEILVLSAGTSDIPIAREAMITAQVMGNRVHAIFDVGVAGIHRLFAHQERIQSASVLVVVAGMEGALPSVIAGLVSAPVIAVPTSVGYGTSFGGITALLGMLNSCSSNVAVVNIDNGFGAGYMASTINRVGSR
ncbi:MAG: nickel pincer cofactor biosynthesis protein LarB [Pseudomonadota bacterium]